MNCRIRLITATATLAIVPFHGAFAQEIHFTGTRSNVNPLDPPGTGRCSPPYFNTVVIAPDAISSTGTSNIGDFESTQSHCITSPPPTSVVDGEFTYRFAAGDSITGTYTGNVDLTATPGTLTGTENLVITGGTGRFVGATGTILETGDLRFLNGNGMFDGTVDGSIFATATTTEGNYATAFGEGTAALGDYSSAFGGLAIANGLNATALGSNAQASAEGATAVGNGTVASGLAGTAVGQFASATAPAATALGHNSVASGIGSTAVGVRATATGTGSTAVGRLSTASGASSSALGAGATATFAGSTAVGTGATTTAANQVALGGSGSSVRIGDIAASTAAQSGMISIATVDANGVIGQDTGLYSSITALDAALTSLDGQVSTLFDLRGADRKDMKQGIAAAMAMSQPSMPSAPGRISYTLYGAAFRGEGAVSASVLYRFNTSVPLAFGAGVAVGGHKNNGVRAGIAGEF